MTETIIISILGSGAFAALISGIFGLIQSRNTKKSAQTRLLMGIAYSEIVSQAQRYIDRGYISVDEFKELEHYFYDPYKQLGGNGTATKLMKEVEALPSNREVKKK